MGDEQQAVEEEQLPSTLARYRADRFAALAKRLGISTDITDLATIGEVSPHDFEELLERGCPPELALDILT